MLRDDQETRNALSQALYGDTTSATVLWSQVIAKANELACETIRVVRCPEVEVAGEIADPIKLHGEDKQIFVEFADGEFGVFYAALWKEFKYRKVVKWCLAFDHLRDPATATWHERTTQRVRRWTPETMPERGIAFVWYSHGGGWTACPAAHNNRAADYLVTKWNDRADPILAWIPLPTITPTVERAP